MVVVVRGGLRERVPKAVGAPTPSTHLWNKPTHARLPRIKRLEQLPSPIIDQREPEHCPDRAHRLDHADARPHLRIHDPPVHRTDRERDGKAADGHGRQVDGPSRCARVGRKE